MLGHSSNTREQVQCSVISTAPGGSTLCSPTRSGLTTLEDEDKLTSGTGASQFAVRSCTAAKKSTTRVGREGSGFHSYRQVENESILATNDIHCVPN